MKKQLVRVFLMLFIAGIFLTPMAWAQMDKLGYVDVTKILEGYQKAKDNEGTLEAEGRQKQQQRDQMVQAVRNLKDEQNLLAEDAKLKKQEEIDKKIRELQDFDVAARQDLGEKRRNVLREIFNDIDVVVKRYAERKGLDFVFSENILLYHNEKYDGTQEVLDELNRDYGKSKKK